MKKIFLLSVLCIGISFCSFNPMFSQNSDKSIATTSDAAYASEEDLIEIIFNQESQVRLRNGSLVDLKTDALNGVIPILEQLDWHNWYRICDVAEDVLDSWSVNGERNTGSPVYNMNNIYRLQIPKGNNIWEICRSIEQLAGVMSAIPVPKPMELPIPPNYLTNQGYLSPASYTPTGIDAAYAWTQTGGTGTGVTVCDLEYSWNYSHADISKGAGSSLNTWTDPGWGNDHGTAVIGELVADNNGWGTTGICHGSGLITCGTYYGSPLSWNVSGAIALAITALSAGDIILLEQQWEYTAGAGNYIPIEWWGSTTTPPDPPNQFNNAVYIAIVNAVSNGINVVEAGGNGNVNTDGMTWYGNSGAIIVGAGGASAANDLQRLSFSSYGSRFDLQGWGENVVTTGYGDLYGLEGSNYWYTSTFSGTSSASPIVAGALACAEGYYLANVSATPPTPAIMRTHLKTYGTAQITPPIGNIGPRPNLYAAINNFPPPAQTLDFGDLPDSYLTTLGSNGARHLIGNYFLGLLIDAEGDGIPSANADSDDNTGSDDEDGVVFSGNFSPGGTTNITVTASIAGGLLQCWIDFNNNGIFDIPSEEVFVDQPLVAGPNILSITTPASAVIGSTYTRFRFSSSLYAGLIFYSYCADGEVEDYKVDIETNQGSSLKWEQLPDLSPTGMDVDATFQPDNPENPPLLLADDFLCTETGNITDIHIWGSWIDDHIPFFEDPAAVKFTFSIHSDIPDPDGPGPEFSMPGDMLWMRTWIPGLDDVEEIVSGPEDWYNPFFPMWLDDNHQMCYKYNYILDPQDYFLQEGTEQNPIVYWLDVQAEPMDIDPACRFGWKTSLDHWNDDAVWIDAIELYDGPWNELRYPVGHEFETESIDLAFQITTEEGPTDEYDFGDAPEGDNALAYPTGVTGLFPTCITVGPVGSYVQHGSGENLSWFGQTVDLEADGNAGLCPGCFPSYNDDECFNDGDAGLIMPDSYTIDATGSVVICPSSTGSSLGTTCYSVSWGIEMDIDVTNTMPVDAYVNVLCDWNQNGLWQNDPNTQCGGIMTPEHVLADFIIPAGYSGPLSALMISGGGFQIGPNDGYVWVRFSITESPVQTNDWDGSGVFEDGETEDYLLYVEDQVPEELDFGDASDPLYPTLLASTGANHIIDGVTYMGASVDGEPDGQQTPFADGDDLDGNDDEDGIIFNVNPIIIGSPNQVNVTTSAAGYLQGWIDFNADGDWMDPGEQIFIDTYIHFAGTVCLNYYVPSNASTGITYARFRFSTVGGLGLTGQAPDGEVEDYEVDITDNPDLKWSQQPCEYLPGLHCHDFTDPANDITIADDWLCNGGVVTDIHWWGNYEAINSGINYFHLSIHADDPTGTCLPIPELWGVDVPLALTNETATGLFSSDGNMIYSYDYILDIPFEQEEGTNYWLDISAHSNNMGNYVIWRWQESSRSTTNILCPAADKTASTAWQMIDWITPQPTRYSDMAFEITSVEIIEEFDFGDANEPNYPTYFASDGARHIIDGFTFLGATVDPEPDGQPDPQAMGDDNDGNDDEDGVTVNPIFQITPGGSAWFDVVASVSGSLNVWIDWNANGSWGDAVDHVVANLILTTGNNAVVLPVPANAVIGNTYARFRFSTVPGLSYMGPAPDGEVEDYEITIGGNVDVTLKAFLEGPFNGTNMNTDLNTGNLIPLSQPYDSDASAPWYYTGTESVVSIPNPNVVDWIMVEFRDAPSPAAATGAMMVSQQAAFILADGSIVGLDGFSPIQTNGIYSHSLYVVIWHRNHLGIMSSGPIVPTGINQYTYDFTGGPGQAYLNGQKNLGGGIYGMAGGDGKPDGTVDNLDIISIWSIAAGTKGYLMIDYNMDIQSDNKDKNNVWYPNIGSGSQVPN